MISARVAAVAILVVTTACTTQAVQNKEDMLAAAGFTLVPANTPQRQASLATLPPHKFVHQIRGNNVLYTYAVRRSAAACMSETRRRMGATARMSSCADWPMSSR
jgi:hypothetical protein